MLTRMSNWQRKLSFCSRAQRVESEVKPLSAVRQDVANKIEEALQAQDFSRLKELTELYKSSSEGEKVSWEVDALSRNKRTEGKRFWLPLLATWVGAIAVVATLFVQIHQINQNLAVQTRATEEQRQANEATEFRDMVANANLPQGLAAASGIVRLQSFLSSSVSNTYKQEAHDLALLWLNDLPNKPLFQRLFDQIMGPDHTENLRNLVQLSSLQRLALQDADYAVAHRDEIREAPPLDVLQEQQAGLKTKCVWWVRQSRKFCALRPPSATLT